MEILKVILYLVGGGVVLGWGSNLFVDAASGFSRRLGISPLIIGLTVVSLGTSAPEMAVNILAASQGKTDLAMGNVIGSNIFNIAFILGLCATLSPLFVTNQLVRVDIPIMTAASILLWIMAQDFSISRFEGIILVILIILYMLLQVRMAVSDKSSKTEFETEYAQGRHPGKEVFILISGLLLLVAGAHFFVEGAVTGARLLGWSEAVIGLTIIAAGTSLPEVATSVVATLKGERDIAIGNVVGSNIFNILAVIGLSATISPVALSVSNHLAQVDTTVMIFITLLTLPFCIMGRKLGRRPGILLFLSWVVYTYYLVTTT